MAKSSAAGRSLLENEEVVSYLQDLDALEAFGSESSLHPTDTPEFRAEVIALGDGMLEQVEPGADQASVIPIRTPFHPHDEPDDADDPPAATAPLPPLGTALFLLGMSLIGASSAALVFHDRVFRLLGW